MAFTPKVATKSLIQYQQPSPKIFEELSLQLWCEDTSIYTIVSCGRVKKKPLIDEMIYIALLFRLRKDEYIAFANYKESNTGRR